MYMCICLTVDNICVFPQYFILHTFIIILLYIPHYVSYYTLLCYNIYTSHMLCYIIPYYYTYNVYYLYTPTYLSIYLYPDLSLT